MQKARKLPMRMCLGCNEMKLKRELIRVVRSPEGETSLDFTGKKSGRGAYICKDMECFKKARKSRRIEKSLGCSVSQEVYEVMENELANENNKDD